MLAHQTAADALWHRSHNQFHVAIPIIGSGPSVRSSTRGFHGVTLDPLGGEDVHTEQDFTRTSLRHGHDDDNANFYMVRTRYALLTFLLEKVLRNNSFLQKRKGSIRGLGLPIYLILTSIFTCELALLNGPWSDLNVLHKV